MHVFLRTASFAAALVLSSSAASADEWVANELTLAEYLQEMDATRGDMMRVGAAGLEGFSASSDNRVVRGDGMDVVSGQIDDPDFFTVDAAADSDSMGIVTTVGQTFSGLKSFPQGITAPTSSAGNVFSGGTYAATVSNESANISSTTVRQVFYIRVGNIVYVNGTVDVTTTNASPFNFELSIPVASSFSSGYDLAGQFNETNRGKRGRILGDTGNDTAQFSGIADGAGSGDCTFSFAYLVE